MSMLVSAACRRYGGFVGDSCLNNGQWAQTDLRHMDLRAVIPVSAVATSRQPGMFGQEVAPCGGTRGGGSQDSKLGFNVGGGSMWWR
jgi:hypothetical protein